MKTKKRMKLVKKLVSRRGSPDILKSKKTKKKIHYAVNRVTAVCEQPDVSYAHVVMMQELEDETVAQINCYPGYEFPNKAVSAEAVCLDGVWHNITDCQLRMYISHLSALRWMCVCGCVCVGGGGEGVGGWIG